MRVMRVMAGNSLPFLRNMAEKVIFIKLGRKYPAITRITRIDIPYLRAGPPPEFPVCGSEDSRKFSSCWLFF